MFRKEDRDYKHLDVMNYIIARDYVMDMAKRAISKARAVPRDKT